MIRKSLLAVCAALATSAGAASAAGGGIEVGILTCEQTHRTDLIVWSEAQYVCRFRPISGQAETYAGKIGKLGLELSVDNDESFAWAVISPTADTSPGALEGSYIGTSADVSIGAGGGVRGLIGGFRHSITLQPLAPSGETGFGLAAGIEAVKLTAVSY